MELTDLIQIAKAYQSLGWAVQEQLDNLLMGDGAECNPNALRWVGAFLRKIEDSTDDEGLIEEIAELRNEINSLVLQKRGSE